MANFDPRRLFDAVERYVPVTLRDGDQELTIMMPEDNAKDQSQEAIKKRSLAALQRLRVAEKVLDRERIKERANKDGLTLLNVVAEMTATIVAANVIAIYVERAKENREECPYLDAQDGEKLAGKLSNRLRQLVLDVLAETDGTAEHLEAWLWQNIAAWALADMERELGTQTIRNMSDQDFTRTLNEYVFDKQDVTAAMMKLVGLYTQDLARLFLDALDPEHRPLDELRRFLDLPGAARVNVRDAFRNGAALIPRTSLLEVDSSALFQRLREVLATKSFKTPEGERWPVADLTTPSQKVRATAQLRPDPVDVELVLTDEELRSWQDRMTENVMAMDDLTADVLDVISAVWLRQADHYESMATVTADDFLRLRGLKPQKSGTGRRGGYKGEWRREIARHLAILSNVWITVAEMEVTEEVEGKRGPRRRRITFRGESKAVVVSSRFGQVKLDGTMDAFAWRVRPGDVFAKFLFGPGRQTALLSQKALEYDPWKQKWEKRLTRYLAWQWRARQGNGNYLHPFLVGTLLDAVGVKVDQTNPTRTKERLEKALDTLQADGVIANWQYETAEEEKVGKRGWWKEWLGWRVFIEPPQQIIDQYAKIKNQPGCRALPVPRTATILDPAQIRRARKEQGLSLLQAAEQIGISASRLSRIERGERPNPENLRKLRAWLEAQA